MFKRLKHIFLELPEVDQKSLVDFGELLLSRIDVIISNKKPSKFLKPVRFEFL